MTKKDMHLHSKFSDGKDSIEKMTQAAIKFGYKEIAFTDHVRRDTKWLGKYIEEIKRVQKKYPNIKIYSGIEAKVINLRGDIDARSSFFKKIDLVLGVFHRIPKGEEIYFSKEEILNNKKLALEFWYRAIMKVLENKNVNIIAHPTAILKEYRIKLPNRVKEKIAKKAKKEGKIFEINKKFGVPNNKFIKILRKEKIKLIYGSDSHSVKELTKFIN